MNIEYNDFDKLFEEVRTASDNGIKSDMLSVLSSKIYNFYKESEPERAKFQENKLKILDQLVEFQIKNKAKKPIFTNVKYEDVQDNLDLCEGVREKIKDVLKFQKGLSIVELNPRDYKKLDKTLQTDIRFAILALSIDESVILFLSENTIKKLTDFKEMEVVDSALKYLGQYSGSSLAKSKIKQQSK